MSWQWMEAVQDCEAIENHTALAIMYAIARHVNVEGVTGWGGRMTSPSINTIARKARCHRNTVLNWLPKLEDAGLLTVERLGNGRGAWNKYTLHVPINNNGTSESVIGTSDRPIDDFNGSEDVPIPKEMVQAMASNIELLVQVLVHNGTSLDGLDTKETDIYTHPHNENVVTGHQIDPPYNDFDVGDMMSAIAGVVKTTLVAGINEAEFRAVATALIADGMTPEQVRGFSDWWAEHGYYKGLPTLKSLLGEIKNMGRVNGVVVQQTASGGYKL